VAELKRDQDRPRRSRLCLFHNREIVAELKRFLCLCVIFNVLFSTIERLWQN